MSSASEKVCRRCNVCKPATEFHLRSSAKDGLRPECKACVSEINKAQYDKHADKRKADQRAYRAANLEACNERARAWHKANPERSKRIRVRWQREDGWATTLLCRARTTAKDKGYEFDLDLEWIQNLYERQNGECFWYYVKLRPTDEARNPLQPSLDRIDCSKGYIKSNVVLACSAANLGRSNTHADAFRRFADLVTSGFVHPTITET